MVNDGGIVTTLRPGTGETIAQSRLKGATDAFYASPIAADNKVFMASERGKIAVLPTDGSLEPVAVNDMEDDIYATPGDFRRGGSTCGHGGCSTASAGADASLPRSRFYGC